MTPENDHTDIGSPIPRVGPVAGHRVEWTDDGCRYLPAEAEPPSEAIITAVNTCLERDGRDLSLAEQTPLYNAIDPDALDSFISLADSSIQQVSFTYLGYTVTVTGDCAVHLTRDVDIGGGSR